VNLYQSKIVALCLILSETVWLYSIYAVVGIIISLGRSPLSYGGCVALYAVSLYLSRLFNAWNLKVSLAICLQTFVGAILCYFTVGYTNLPSQETFSLYWIFDLEHWVYGEGEVGLAIVLAAFMSVFMWVKGGLTGSTDFPLETLSSTFRIGIIVMAFTVTIDIFNEADLYMSTLMYLFFASALSGLAIGRLKPSSNSGVVTLRWLRVVSILVGMVVLSGVLFASFSKDFLGAISSPVTTLISWITMAIVYLLAIPIIYAIQFIIRFFSWIFGDALTFDRPVQEQQGIIGLGNVLEELINAPVSEEPSVFMQYFEYFAIFILVIGLLFGLGIAFKRINRSKNVVDDGIKSKIEGSEDSMTDLLEIAKRLLWKRGLTKEENIFVIPRHLDSGSKTVLESYYGLLVLGSQKGVNRSRNSTPKEFEPALYRSFDVDSVRRITKAFMDVCYGRVTPIPSRVAEIRALIENLGK
jgi:hypothetical protein